MKKLLFHFLLGSLALPVFATIRTVNNMPSPQAQYSTIQAAVDASSSGDSIYVNSSPLTYEFFTINNKKLAIFGPGWSPNKETVTTATLNGCSLTGIGVTGSEFHGLNFTSSVTIVTSNINKLLFLRNRFGSSSSAVYFNTTGMFDGFLFEGNWFDDSYIYNGFNNNTALNNFTFTNNLFVVKSNKPNIIGFTNTQNIFFDHNLWYGNNAIDQCFQNNCRFLNFSNNIFVGRDVAKELSSSTFTNNLTFNCASNSPWTLNGNSNAGSNLAGLDPQMVDQAAVNTGTDNPLLDFTLTAGSPGKNKASDGKDLGLLFDATGVSNWKLSRGAHLPFISKMKITNPPVVNGNTLTVVIEAKKN